MEEKEIQNDIMDLCVKHPKVAWAYVTTTGKIKGRGGHWITLGITGMPDIMGQLKDGRLFGIEVKKLGERPTKEQSEFIDKINKNNGVAGWVNNTLDAKYILDGVSRGT